MNFLRPYLRGWVIIVGAMVLAYLVAKKYLTYVTPMYESTTRLRLADLNEGVPGSNLFKDLDVFVSTQKINAEIELLKSHVIIGKALDKVGFDVQIFREGNIKKTELFDESPLVIKPVHWEEKQKDKEFRIWVLDTSNYSIFTPGGEVFQGKIGKQLEFLGCTLLVTLNHKLIAEKANLQIADHYIFSVYSRNRLIKSTLTDLNVVPVDKDVPVLRITYKSSHPLKASLLPNALAEAYINDYIENKFGAANVTVDFLDERIDEVGDKLTKAEQALMEYREEKGITNIQQETETILRKISQLQIQQTNLKMTLEAIRDLEAYVVSGQGNFLELAPNFEAFTDLLSTELVKNIKLLQAEKKDLLLIYTDQNEKVKVIDEKIKDLTSYLTESIRNTRNNLEVKYLRLIGDISDVELLLVDVPENERMITILRREFDIFQQSYNFLNEKRIEAEIARSAKISFHRIITPATVSKTPISPNTIIIKAVAAILGMFGAILLIFIVHMLKARVNNMNTVEMNSNIPVLLSVPRHANKVVGETWFIQALTNLEVKGLVPKHGVVCFTGYTPKEGMNYVSKGMERVMDLQQRQLLVVHLHPGSNPRADEAREIRQVDERKHELIIYEVQLRNVCTEDVQQLILRHAQKADYTLIRNFGFGRPFTVAVMAIAQLNIACIDTRLTPAKLLAELNRLNDEFACPGMYLAVNRVGYSPSFIREVFIFTRNCYRRLKKSSTT